MHWNDRPAFVYRLTNSVTGKQYIGICVSKVQRRWRKHCNSAAANQPRNRNCPALHGAIRKYGEAAFTIETLYEAVNWQEACKVERGLIAQYGTMAPNGYNLTCGGEGLLGRPMSEANKLANSLRMKGNKMSPEQRERISASNRGKKRSPEVVEAMRARSKLLSADPARRAAMSELAKAPERVAISLANVQKAIASNVGRSPDEKTRTKMSAWQVGKKHSAETKAKIGAKAAGRKKTPEQIEEMRQREFTPAHRAKIKAALKDRYFSPEHRARITEGLKRRWARQREEKSSGPLS